MRIANKTYPLLLTCLLVLVAGKLASQEVYTEENLIERVFLVSDRDVYFAGENMYFSSFNLSDPSVQKLDLSKVLYVEILTPGGQAVAQGKFRFNRQISQGTLTIPSSIQTGNYYLRAYTKWMRNFSPYAYFYKPLKLVNPHSTELLQATNGSPVHMKTVDAQKQENPHFKLTTTESNYGTRQKVSARVNSSSTSPQSISVSVFREELYAPFKTIEPASYQRYTAEYWPETRGLSVSGRVIKAADSAYLPFTPVQLTLFTENHEMFTTRADGEGRFAIALPGLNGTYELFISAHPKNNDLTPAILIDNDFCSRNVNLPFIPFSFTDSEKEVFNELSINHQVSEMYKPANDSLRSVRKLREPTFYGEADYTVKLREYIELPTLQDYIHEFMPNIAIKQRHKTKYLKVLGQQADLGIYEPLVLLDMVPINDINRILAIAPKNIDKVEVIGVPYILGDEIYGGIISFFSVKGDLAGIDLPEWGNFIRLNFYRENISQANFNSAANDRIPDLRNTLYWNHELLVQTGKTTEFEFSTGDVPGNYIILITGIDSEGNIVRRSERIRVE